MLNSQNLLETDKRSEPYRAASSTTQHLQGKRVAMVAYSYYKFDPRIRRAAEALIGAGMNVELICLRKNRKGVSALRRDSVVSVMYPEELDSAKSSVTLQRAVLEVMKVSRVKWIPGFNY